MEFSLFLVLLTLAGAALFLVLSGLMQSACRLRAVRFGLLVLPIALFFVNVTAAVFSAAAVIVLLIAVETKPLDKKRTLWLIVFFWAFMAGLGFAYLRKIVPVWVAIDQWVAGLFGTATIFKSSRFAEVFSVAQYFRVLYPVLLSVLMLFVFDMRIAGKKNGHKKSYWRRFYRNFDHRLVYPMVVFWTLYFALLWAAPLPGFRLNVPGVWANLLLESAVFFSALYAVYGAQTVLSARRFRVPANWSLAGLFLIVVLSGPVFLFTLTFIMGIGISDIWMHYDSKKIKRAVLK